MKQHATIILTFGIITLLAFRTGMPARTAGPLLPPGTSHIDSVLTGHRWTLVEMIQEQNNTPTNLTLLMMPCEKDNFLVYSHAGTYQIREGATKCNTIDDTVRGQGSWEYHPEDTSLVEKYGGGARTYKKIITISDDLLKIQYEGEGKRTFTLTYLSEKGNTKEESQDLMVDESDPSQKVMRVIRQYLQTTNHYTLLNNNDLATWGTVRAGNAGSPKPTVALVPFVDEKDAGKTEERNNALVARAKSAGVDYVITGRLDEARTVKNNDNFMGTVQFRVDVLDIKGQGRHSKIFNGGEEKNGKEGEAKKHTGAFGRFIKKAGDIGEKVAGPAVALLGNQKLINSLYAYSTLNSALSGKTYEAINLFSTVNNELRKRHFDSTTAVVKAVAATAEEVEQFVADHAALPIKILRIEGSGKDAVVVLGAATTIQLRENEILKVVELKNAPAAGDMDAGITPLGEIRVTKITGDAQAYCTVKEKNSGIAAAFNKTPDNIFILTTRQHQ